jgi:hypothetical protein
MELHLFLMSRAVTIIPLWTLICRAGSRIHKWWSFAALIPLGADRAALDHGGRAREKDGAR